jgi:predicted dinucleotide-binding enzyme
VKIAILGSGQVGRALGAGLVRHGHDVVMGSCDPSTELLDCGWPSVDAGGIEAPRLLEPMAILWVNHAIAHGSGDHAFKLLRP